MNELDKKIKEFYELKIQLDELNKRKDMLTEEIKSLMIQNGIDDYNNNELCSKLTYKTTFKYKDEVGIINYLTQKGLASTYMSNKIDTTKLNKELKNKGQLFESLKNYIIKEENPSLSISKK